MCRVLAMSFISLIDEQIWLSYIVGPPPDPAPASSHASGHNARSIPGAADPPTSPLCAYPNRHASSSLFPRIGLPPAFVHRHPPACSHARRPPPAPSHHADAWHLPAT
ncbi:hypothetical protein GUJ93_ZPchr0013g36085 [Zizania palustris]|uniref:Uncharacterized protein n=1 Tax=Zizania palustris TaxID=103762 RepID=A0A8J5XA11_ZIZPA|nr:hypothetical protein GUJ93_ZPchr0013g36085 [Zizania palustris]